MNRRRFLQRTSIPSGGLALALPEITREQELTSRSWQIFEVTKYPQAETADGRLDSLDPGSFQYQITSRKQAASRINRKSGEGKA
jgi:hypothetical protein